MLGNWSGAAIIDYLEMLRKSAACDTICDKAKSKSNLRIEAKVRKER